MSAETATASPTGSAAAAPDARPAVVGELARQLGREPAWSRLADGTPEVWVGRDDLRGCLAALKPRWPLLFDISGIDERTREHRLGQPSTDFTAFYHLMGPEQATDLRLKVAMSDADASRDGVPSVADIFPVANWYERELWDMFGVRVSDHPNLRRILTPPEWDGHPLRKEHPARATEFPRFEMTPEFYQRQQEALRFVPEDWGMARRSTHTDFMFLNLGPNHPSVHGVFRICLQLDGEVIVDCVPDIGYHHRGAEKMAERQTWHTYIPYTDRIDYLGGVMNNLPYVLAVEQLAGIEVPPRAQVIRVMLAEFFRICSHLVFYGTFAQDVGQLSPVFYMFVDRERAFSIVEAITGGRMHPSWFRIGGVAHDLPEGWDKLVRSFIDTLPKRLDHYEKMAMQNRILKERSIGIGQYNTAEALDWGVTGPGLRATGLDWDWRKARPYSGYEQFDFEIPTAEGGDAYARTRVRIDEIRQSLRIIRQCLEHMPSGPYKSEHRLTTPPRKERTMEDIETLIHHFLNTTWGPVMPPGESCQVVEATKGLNGYSLVSDGGTGSYRTRIRTPSFPHLQMIPFISRGLMVADLITIIASIDFVMADVDR